MKIVVIINPLKRILSLNVDEVSQKYSKWAGRKPYVKLISVFCNHCHSECLNLVVSLNPDWNRTSCFVYLTSNWVFPLNVPTKCAEIASWLVLRLSNLMISRKACMSFAFEFTSGHFGYIRNFVGCSMFQTIYALSKVNNFGEVRGWIIGLQALSFVTHSVCSIRNTAAIIMLQVTLL